MPFYLYWDESAPEAEGSKLRRSVFGSLAEAKAQADADRVRGRNVVCVEKSRGLLGVSESVVGGRNVVVFERGEIVG